MDGRKDTPSSFALPAVAPAETTRWRQFCVLPPVVDPSLRAFYIGLQFAVTRNRVGGECRAQLIVGCFSERGGEIIDASIARRCGKPSTRPATQVGELAQLVARELTGALARHQVRSVSKIQRRQFNFNNCLIDTGRYGPILFRADDIYQCDDNQPSARPWSICTT